MDKQPLEAKLFRMFEKQVRRQQSWLSTRAEPAAATLTVAVLQERWKFADLQKQTDQPTVWLKEVLQGIGVLSRKGALAGSEQASLFPPLAGEMLSPDVLLCCRSKHRALGAAERVQGSFAMTLIHGPASSTLSHQLACHLCRANARGSRPGCTLIMSSATRQTHELLWARHIPEAQSRTLSNTQRHVLSSLGQSVLCQINGASSAVPSLPAHSLHGWRSSLGHVEHMCAHINLLAAVQAVEGCMWIQIRTNSCQVGPTTYGELRYSTSATDVMPQSLRLTRCWVHALRICCSCWV